MAHKPAPTLPLVDALVQLSFQVQAALARAAAEYDVSPAQMRLMGILRDRRPGMLELARYLHLDKSSMTGLIDRAERRGLVQRVASPDDGRAVRVQATPRGRQLTAEVAAQVEQALNALTAPLSAAEKRQLAALAARLLDEQ